jgi:hypothetical protein
VALYRSLEIIAENCFETLSFRQSQYCIFHIPERVLDAQRLAYRYSRLGASVTTQEVSEHSSIRRNRGKLYYFENKERVAQIAEIIAKDAIKFECLQVQYVEGDYASLNFLIYLVTKRQKQSIQSKIATKLYLGQTSKYENIEKSLVHCPKCRCIVRSDRLNKHVRKPHKAIATTKLNPTYKTALKPAKNQSRKKPYKRTASSTFGNRIYFYNSESINSLPSGPLFGTPSILGWDSITNIKNLQAKHGIRRCRMCGRPAMHDSSECYIHNPK